MKNYDNNANYMWVIASDGQISLSFTFFETEANYDFVHVYQCNNTSCSTREQIIKLSGSTQHGTLASGGGGREPTLQVSANATYTSSTGYLQMVFTSDGSVTGEGFVAEWTSHPIFNVGSSGSGSHFASGDINQDQYYSDDEVIITNPPETSRTYSSICCGSSAGGSHGRSMLDSTSAWVSGNPLVTLNFVSVRTIKGRSS